jgi:hypothetical protein
LLAALLLRAPLRVLPVRLEQAPQRAQVLRPVQAQDWPLRRLRWAQGCLAASVAWVRSRRGFWPPRTPDWALALT